jgi:hypothetical protein
MKSRWFVKLMIITLIIALLPVLVVSAANGPTQQTPVPERTMSPLQHARSGRVVINEAAESVSPDDDTPGTAIELQCGWTYYGAIDYPGDVDYFYTYFWGGSMLGGFVNASEYGSPLDPVLALYEPDGTTLVSYVDDFDGLDPLVHHTDVLGGGNYYWEVSGFGGGSTGDYWFTVDSRIYLTTKKNGTVDGINYRKGDILVYNRCAGYWEMFLDASDLGIMKGINDMAIVPEVDGILMSMPSQNTAFGPASSNNVYDLWTSDVGWDTAANNLYTFLDGGAVGLMGKREQVDGVLVTPWRTLGISTNGNATVPYTGDVDTFADEDIVDLQNASYYAGTTGDWYMLYDTSDTGAGPIDTHGIYMNNYWYDVYTVFDKVSDFGWGKRSVVGCFPYQLGWDTGCFYLWEEFFGPAYGMPKNVNLRGLDFGTDFYPDGYFIPSADAAGRGNK